MASLGYGYADDEQSLMTDNVEAVSHFQQGYGDCICEQKLIRKSESYIRKSFITSCKTTNKRLLASMRS
jgi:hypothetical protein